MRSKLITNLEKELTIIAKEKTRLERKLKKIPFSENETTEITIFRQELNSKLFWLGSLSGEIKTHIEIYSELAEKINAINLT